MLDRTVAYGLDFLFPVGDKAIGQSLAVYGEFARPMVDLLIDYADGAPGAFVDVGANIGSICLPFAAARRDWRVVGVEASRSISSVLAANAMGNHLTNVEVVQAAAGGRTGVVEFPNASLGLRGNYGTLSLSKRHHEMAKTLMVTLDDLATPNVRLVKIDAEGEDAAVLEGAQRLLHEVRPVWVVEADPKYPKVAEPVIRTLQEAGYAVHWFWTPWATEHRAKGRGPTYPLVGDRNVVALPPGVPNKWDLPLVTGPAETRPGRVEDYGYLARYGIQTAE